MKNIGQQLFDILNFIDMSDKRESIGPFAIRTTV